MPTRVRQCLVRVEGRVGVRNMHEERVRLRLRLRLRLTRRLWLWLWAWLR